MGNLVLLSLLAALYPTLIAATTVMVLLPEANNLMLGFWAGAMITSLSCGLVIVFAIHDSKTVHTTRHTVTPAVDLAFAVILAFVAVLLAKGGDRRVRERVAAHRPPKTEKKTPKWQKALQEGNPWHTFLVGIVLSFPGIWYLAALDHLRKLRYSTAAEVFVVVGFCIVQLSLIEVPMLASRIWPTQTLAAIDNTRAWVSRHGRQYGARGLATIAALLVVVAGIGALG